MISRRHGERGSTWARMGLAAVVAAALSGFGEAESGAPKGANAEEGNEVCLACHTGLSEATTLSAEVKEAHRRHLESTMTEFGGRQRVCTTCHEAFSADSHPATANEPTAYWRLRVRKPEVAGVAPSLPLLAPENPQIFKPTLRRMVCLECHSRKVKVFYPAEPR